jgi:hypothetical protein
VNLPRNEMNSERASTVCTATKKEGSVNEKQMILRPTQYSKGDGDMETIIPTGHTRKYP